MANVLELKREHEVTDDKNKIIVNTSFKEEFDKDELRQIANKRAADLVQIRSQLSSMKMQLEKIDRETKDINLAELEELKKKMDVIDKLKMKENLQKQVQNLEREQLVAEKDSVEFSRIANLVTKERESSSEGK